MKILERAWFVVALASAVGLPYVVSTSGTEQSESGSPLSPAVSDKAAEFVGSPAGDATVPSQLPTEPRISALDLSAPPHVLMTPISEVFRFDRTVAWVLATWARVSTSLSELDLQGYRVALVSGTSPGDLAGSLTYYFSADQKLAKITFNGTTGDVAPLVHWLQTQVDFRPTVPDDPRLTQFQVRKFGKVTSELRVRPARVVRADHAQARFEVDLRMQHPEL